MERKDLNFLSDVLHKYSGSGILLVEKCKKKIKCNFIIEIYYNSQIKIYTNCDFSVETSNIIFSIFHDHLTTTLEGKINELKMPVLIKNMSIVKTTDTLSKDKKALISCEFISNTILLNDESGKAGDKVIEFGIANLFFNGIDWSPTKNGRTRDKFEIKINNHKFIFKQTKWYKTIKDLDSRFPTMQLTSYITIQSPKKSNYEKDISDLCLLLSLAKGSCINWISERHYLKNKLVYIKHRDILQRSTKRISLIPDNTPWNPVLKNFLESCFNSYREINKVIDLVRVINYYIESKYQDYLELKYISLYVAAKTFVNEFNRWKKTNYKIKFGLKQIAKYYELDENKFDFVDTAESIINTGSLPKDISINDYLKAVNQMGKFLLSALNYKGTYLDCSNNYEEKIL